MQSHRLQHNINCQNRNHLANHSSLFASVAMQQPLRVGSDLITPVLVVRDLGIHIDADVSMRSHVMKTMSACFAVLRRLRGIHRSVPRTVFQSLVSCLVLLQLDYCNAVLAGIPLHLAWCLQSVMNAAAWLVFASSRCDHIMPITLAESSMVDRLQAGSSGFSWPGTVIPCWRTSSSSRVWVSKASAFHFVSRTVCSPYPSLSLWRPSISSRRCTNLEQSSAAYHICSVSSCLLLSLEDTLLRTLLPVITVVVPQSDTVIYGHDNRSYLLTA